MKNLIHGRTKLSIMAFLAASDAARTGFNEIRARLGLSAGNLSVQLKQLEAAGYLSIQKEFKSNKPFTGVSITSRGRKKLDDYIEEMEKMIRSLRNPVPGRKK